MLTSALKKRGIVLLPDGGNDVPTRPSGKGQSENVQLLLTFIDLLFKNVLNN